MRAEAVEVLRNLISAIHLTPMGDGLAMDITGNLASILALATTEKPAAGAAGGQTIDRLGSVEVAVRARAARIRAGRPSTEGRV